MEQKHVAVVGEEYCSSEEERELTVRKTSLFSSGDGFEAYDNSTGDIVFRVDNYDGRHRGGPSLAEPQILLMDPTGASILTLRKKWPTLHQRWEGFLGERVEGQKPLFSVKWSSIFGGGGGRGVVELLGATANSSTSNVEYRVEGCFAQRCCRIVMVNHSISEEDEDDVVVGDYGDCNDVDDDRSASSSVAVLLGAEVKRKVDPCANIVLGKDVFSLCIKPGFDAAFAMGLVLVLDQISRSDGDSEHNNIAT
ncbi:putative protein LURP-one-related 5 [Iris pallida]|uniref:Uncharacterized protein n=1 Tax=Iris pallida TaxID=29817 RepID=A0AAX6G7E3_IRIPA|nr:putative protein LURP-one-related 5 [Iris pallida]KAJ6824532.1 putative protein LURP-one-related 5 [Iris pallida]